MHGDIIGLCGPPLVETDIRRAHDHLVEAERARWLDNATEEVARLERAVTLWRGDPLVDLETLSELDGEIEQLRRGAARLGTGTPA